VRATGQTTAVTDLRLALDAAGYTEEAVTGLIGPWAAGQGDVVVLRLRARGEEALAVLVRLLLLGLPQALDPVTTALGSAGLAAAEALGVVRCVEDRCVPLLRVEPWRDLLLVSDLADDSGRPTRPDHVMGVTASTAVLADLTPRSTVGTVLDVGCGAGVQALLASRHSRSVTATDLQPRCAALTALNAGLNAVDVDVRVGDLAAPVAGERFDLVVANPPFVLGAGAPGWGAEEPVTDRLLSDLPALLSAGGVAVVLANWSYDPAEGPEAPMLDRLAEWPGDRWVILLETHDTPSYAAGWSRGLPPARRQREAAAWVGRRSSGTRHVAGGVLVLRHRVRRGWTRVDDGRRVPCRPGPRFLPAQLAVEDLLSDETMLLRAAVQRCAGVDVDVRLDHTLVPVSVRVAAGDGLGVSLWSDPGLLDVLRRADGRPVADMLADLPAGIPARAALLAVRTLLRLGVLEPAEQDLAVRR